MFSFIVLAFFTMFLFPEGEQIWPVLQKAHYAVDVLFGDGLEHDATKLVFQKPDFSTCLDLMLAAKLRRNHQLALGCKCSTYIFHALQCIISKTSLEIVLRRHSG